jgi:two-component system, NtrC family, sensor kinase
MPIDTFTKQLHEYCRLTGARWAVQLEQEGPSGPSVMPPWVILDYHGLSASAVEALAGQANQAPLLSWLAHSLESGRPRTRGAEKTVLGAALLYAIPVASSENNHQGESIEAGIRRGGAMLLIGAEELDAQAKKLWQLAALVAGRVQRDNLLEQELQDTRQELQARVAAQAAAEQRLIQAAKLAAVGEMAAGVAHELNNPLTTIVGFTELLLEDLPHDSESRPDLETVLREALRARDVVRRLLDFSRRSEMVRSRSDINAIVGDTLSLVRHLLSTGGVQVHTDLDDSLPWGFVDRDQIKQVLLNLLHNALAAMPHGGRINLVTAVRKKYGADWITITVQDTGVGIPPENMERIFEPFFTTRAGQGGTGLGLAVTYGIVSSHGGMIEAESAPGAGATFTVWLPVEERPQ